MRSIVMGKEVAGFTTAHLRGERRKGCCEKIQIIRIIKHTGAKVEFSLRVLDLTARSGGGGKDSGEQMR